MHRADPRRLLRRLRDGRIRGASWRGTVVRRTQRRLGGRRRRRGDVGPHGERTRDELRGLLQAFRDKAASAGLAEHEKLDPRYAAARQVLWSAPCDLTSAEHQVDEYVRTINQMMHGVN